MANSTDKRDFISFADFNRKDVWAVLERARALKRKRFSATLKSRTIGLIFQKPSTRTSVSFAVGIVQLGGHPLILNADVLQIKRGETPKDTGRVLSRYLDAVVVRANRHADVLEMASYASVPVINGLTDREHPCQVMADLLTLMEHRRIRHPRDLSKLRVAFLGDGNNVSHSWALAASMLGITLVIASPRGYEPSPDVLREAEALARAGKGTVSVVSDPAAAATGADALYTDVWASMGQEDESAARRKDFAPFQVNRQLLSRAKRDAVIMHCLPAHRGEEITDDVIEGPNSVVFDQAENRLHVQKAILATLVTRRLRK